MPFKLVLPNLHISSSMVRSYLVRDTIFPHSIGKGSPGFANVAKMEKLACMLVCQSFFRDDILKVSIYGAWKICTVSGMARYTGPSPPRGGPAPMCMLVHSPHTHPLSSLQRHQITRSYLSPLSRLLLLNRWAVRAYPKVRTVEPILLSDSTLSSFLTGTSALGGGSGKGRSDKQRSGHLPVQRICSFCHHSWLAWISVHEFTLLCMPNINSAFFLWTSVKCKCRHFNTTIHLWSTTS